MARAYRDTAIDDSSIIFTAVLELFVSPTNKIFYHCPWQRHNEQKFRLRLRLSWHMKLNDVGQEMYTTTTTTSKNLSRTVTELSSRYFLASSKMSCVLSVCCQWSHTKVRQMGDCDLLCVRVRALTANGVAKGLQYVTERICWWLILFCNWQFC